LWFRKKAQTQGPERYYPHEVQDRVNDGKESIECYSKVIGASPREIIKK
jgi:hypothetical protein